MRTPRTGRRAGGGCSGVDTDQSVTGAGAGVGQNYTFDQVFWSVNGLKDASGLDPVGQQHVYDKIGRPLVDHAFAGFNSCLFAYGQTGSGKTYTMMGSNVMSLQLGNEEAGIIPRVCQDIFKRKAAAENEDGGSWSVEIGYVEVYNERVSDLLAKRRRGKEEEDVYVEVRENPTKGVYLDGQQFVSVNSVEEVLHALEKGNKLRHTAETKMNNRSSRSHAILMIHLKEHRQMVTKHEGSITTEGVTSRMNLVDLAGSERVLQSEVEGEQFTEATHINLSLTTLGRVIDILADIATNPKGNAMTAVPFRDSKLTHILKESLRGNSKTYMIATVSPSLLNTNESVNTLRYASRARDIVNMVQVNEDPQARRIRELEEEIQRLKTEKQDRALEKSDDEQNLHVLRLQQQIDILISEAEHKAAELQMFEKQRNQAQLQVEMRKATEAEKMTLQREAERLKEEVERSRVQADKTFEENRRMKEEQELLRRKLEENQVAFSVVRRDREVRIKSMEEQLEEAQEQLRRESAERQRLEGEVHAQQVQLQSLLAHTMEKNSSERQLLVEENQKLLNKVQRLTNELHEKDQRLYELQLVEARYTQVHQQSEWVTLALQEMETRYRDTVFFLHSELEVRAHWEGRHRHFHQMQYEASMTELMQESAAQQDQLHNDLMRLQKKYTEAIEEKRKMRGEVEDLHRKLRESETHLLALQMEAMAAHNLRDTTMKQLEENLRVAKTCVSDSGTETEALRQKLLESERERKMLKARLQAHRDRPHRSLPAGGDTVLTRAVPTGRVSEGGTENKDDQCSGRPSTA